MVVKNLGTEQTQTPEFKGSIKFKIAKKYGY